MSALHYAALEGNLEILKYLLSIQVFIIDDKSKFGILNFFVLNEWIETETKI